MSAALKLQLIVAFVLWISWVLLEVLALRRLGLWDSDLVKDTAIWFLTAGMVLFGAFAEVARTDRFLRRRITRALEVSVVLETVMSLYAFDLWAEMLLVPVLGLLVGVSVVAGTTPEHAQGKKFVDFLLATVGIAGIVYVIAQLIGDWGELDRGDLAAQVALPIALTIGALPFVYVLGVFSAYETAFNRIDFSGSSTPWHRRARAKLALLIAFNVRGRALGRFTGPYQMQLGRTSGFRDARVVIRRGLAEIQRRVDEERAAADRLRLFAGVEGSDAFGRRLDRREFSETRAALRWLAVCMWGWYPRSDRGRYAKDLVDRLGDDFSSSGLPAPAGVVLEVRKDGQAWRAWRRTVTGWCFAIGGSGPPPNEWRYDGAEPPATFPPGPGWFSDFDSEDAANWTDGETTP